jgi:hypothetical protein
MASAEGRCFSRGQRHRTTEPQGGGFNGNDRDNDALSWPKIDQCEFAEYEAINRSLGRFQIVGRRAFFSTC